MSIIETRELTDAELNEVSGGETVGDGFCQGRADGLFFEWNNYTGKLTITAGVGGPGVACNRQGRCGPA